MAETSRVRRHLARALEELLRAAAEAAAGLAERAATGEPESVAALLVRALDAADGPALEVLRAALRRERARWEPRALHDPAAARVRDLFAAVLGVLDANQGGTRDADHSSPTTEAPTARARAPRARARSSARSRSV